MANKELYFLSQRIPTSDRNPLGCQNSSTGVEDDVVKVIHATYRLLDFFPDQDPLKSKAKDKVLAILENLTLVSNAKGWVSLQKEKATAQLLDDIEILKLYLTLGKHQGFIDDVNFLILVKEYSGIAKGINPPTIAMRKNLEVVSSLPNKVPLPSQEKEIPVRKAISELPTSQSGGLNRQEKILKILSEKEKAQVADIIKEIPNITKRTIRRDLDGLLKKGEIIRIGEFNQVFYRKTEY